MTSGAYCVWIHRPTIRPLWPMTYGLYRLWVKAVIRLTRHTSCWSLAITACSRVRTASLRASLVASLLAAVDRHSAVMPACVSSSDFLASSRWRCSRSAPLSRLSHSPANQTPLLTTLSSNKKKSADSPAISTRSMPNLKARKASSTHQYRVWIGTLQFASRMTARGRDERTV